MDSRLNCARRWINTRDFGSYGRIYLHLDFALERDILQKFSEERLTEIS